MADRYDVYTEAVIGETGGQLIWKTELLDPEGRLLATDVASEATGGAEFWHVDTDPAKINAANVSQRTNSATVSSPSADLVPGDRDGLLHPDEQPRVRIWAGMRTGNGDIWWPQSTLAIDETRVGGQSGLPLVSVDLVDSIEPARSDLATAFRFDAGEAVEAVVGRLLGQVLEEGGQYQLAATGSTVLDGDAEVGDERFALIDELLGSCGHELTADPYGLVISREITASIDDGRSRRWVYGGDGIPISSTSRTWTSRTPRGWRVEGGAGVDAAPAPILTVFDLDPNSQGFFPGLGRPVSLRPAKYPHQGSIAQLQRAGYAQLRRHGAGPGLVEFSTLPNPAMRQGDIIDLTVPMYRIDNRPFRVMEMTLPFRNEQMMTVTARAVWEPDLGYTTPGVDVDPNCLASFTDDFDRGDEDLQVLPQADNGSPLWTEIGWSWGVVRNRALQRGNEKRYRGWSLAFVNRPLCDSDHYAEVIIAEVPTGRRAGPVARCDGSFSGYAALIGNGELTLELWLNGESQKALGSIPVAGSPSGRKIRVRPIGSLIEVLLDDQIVITASDDALTGAHVGMLGLGGTSGNPAAIESFASGPA